MPLPSYRCRSTTSDLGVHHIVVAPDKFKESLSALAVAQAIERGLRRGFADVHHFDVIPMADGGEGTVAAFLEGGFSAERRTVSGPHGDAIDAVFAVDGDIAVIEMASASGLALLSSSAYDARTATTFGTGELIGAALDGGATRIVIGIGGSATNDAGAGMLVALGARLLDGEGRALPRGGVALRRLASIDLSGLDARLTHARFEVAADVDNPLCGPTGATSVFGPQKGATPGDVVELEAALSHFADIAASALGRDVRAAPGAGAAGGLGFACLAFLGAQLRPGVEIVGELRGLDAALSGASLCVSGEGRIDGQTVHGKTVAGVALIARRHKVPMIALTGTLEALAEDELFQRGITCVPIVARPMQLDAAMRETATLVERAAARLARTFEVSRRWLSG